jgi:hypothetical protein
MIWRIWSITLAATRNIMRAVLERIVVLATRHLGEFPESGRMIPEAEAPALREIIVQGYRVM